MESNDLLTLNAQGLIPGPNETLEEFRKRVSATKEFFQAQTDSLPTHHWQWPSEQLKALFDFSPRWCSATYSAQGLAPWQAAATWIDVKRIYLIRLRSSKWVSWMVQRDEILAHEAAHAARAAFDESKYEEVFAYMTSSSRWRRVLGPLFQTPKEAALLVALLGIGACAQMGEIFFEVSLFSELWLFSALFFCFAWSVRLMRARTRLEHAAKRLLPFLKDPAMVRPVLFRMTDAEIERLAKADAFQPGSDLRWSVIQTIYWKDIDDAAR